MLSLELSQVSVYIFITVVLLHVRTYIRRYCYRTLSTRDSLVQDTCRFMAGVYELVDRISERLGESLPRNDLKNLKM